MGYAQNWWRYQIEVDLRHSGIYIVNCKRSTLVWCFYCFFYASWNKRSNIRKYARFSMSYCNEISKPSLCRLFPRILFFSSGNCCFKQSDWFLLQGKFLFSLIMKVTSFVTEVLFLHNKVKLFMLLLTRYSISIALFLLLFL